MCSEMHVFGIKCLSSKMEHVGDKFDGFTTNVELDQSASTLYDIYLVWNDADSLCKKLQVVISEVFFFITRNVKFICYLTY